MSDMNVTRVEVEIMANARSMERTLNETQVRLNRFKGRVEAMSDTKLNIETQATLNKFDELEERVNSIGGALNDLDERGEGGSKLAMSYRRNLGKVQDELMETAHQIGIMSDAMVKVSPPPIGPFESFFARIKDQMNGVNKSTKSTKYSLSRMAFGLLGVRSAFALLTTTARLYTRSNDEMQGSVLAMQSAFATILAPAIKHVTRALQELAVWVVIAYNYFATFMNVLFGTNLQIVRMIKGIGKLAGSGLDKATGKAKKFGKELKLALNMGSGLDDFKYLETEIPDQPNMGDTGGIGGDLGGIDTGALDQMNEKLAMSTEKLKAFGEWVKNNEAWLKPLAIAIMSVVGALIMFNLMTKLYQGGMALLSALGNPFFWLALVIAGIVLMIIYWDDVKVVLQKVWDKIQVGIEKFFDWIDANQGLTKAFGILLVSIGLVVALGTIMSAPFAIAGGLIVAVILGIAMYWDDLVVIFNKGIDWIVTKWKNGWSAIKEFFVGIWNWLVDKVKSFGTWCGDTWANIKTGFINSWNGIKTFFVGVWNWLVDKANNIGTTFKNVWNGIGTNFSKAFNGIKTTFSNVWNWILGQFSKAGAIFSGIKDGIGDVFKSVVNGLIGGINRIIAVPFKAVNGMLNGIRSISIMGLKPFQSMWGHNPVGIPRIPQLATGAVVKPTGGGTLVQMAEANRPELAIPLGQSTEFKDMKSDIAKQVLDGMGGTSNGGPSKIDVIVQLEGTTVGRKIIDLINDTQNRVGKTLLEV